MLQCNYLFIEQKQYRKKICLTGKGKTDSFFRRFHAKRKIFSVTNKGRGVQDRRFAVGLFQNFSKFFTIFNFKYLSNIRTPSVNLE